jgi:hypothetical protein
MDPKKISKGFYTDELSQLKRRIPVIHFTQAISPIIICVKLVRMNILTCIYFHSIFLGFNK